MKGIWQKNDIFEKKRFYIENKNHKLKKVKGISKIRTSKEKGLRRKTYGKEGDKFFCKTKKEFHQI